jgi:hypothetical protein
MATSKTSKIERVPFSIAIAAPELLKPRFDTLSQPQQVILKAFYGLPLNESELLTWSMLQGGATFDDLGYVTGIQLVPYLPQEYNRLIAVLGRRSGKTDMIVGTAAAYEMTLGGHREYVRAGQKYKLLFFAQSKQDAQTNMQFIRMALEESPRLSKEIEEAIATEIRMKDGMVVEPVPVGKAIGRGHAVPVVIMDEAAFWYTDENAANPDFEVMRAVSYSQLQFMNPKMFIPSTPWVEKGILWTGFQAGTNGRKLKCEQCKRDKAVLCEHNMEARERYTGTLVVHAPTASMESLDKVLRDKAKAKRRLIEIRRDDPEAYPRESLALFIKSASGWLNKDNIAKAIDLGTYSRSRKPGISYVATIDPAFRKDSFALTIGHYDLKLGLVQDFIRYWTPEVGRPLQPGPILDEIKVHLTSYGLSMVTSDQYQLEALQQLAMDRGFVINGLDFTGSSKAKITGSFKVLLDQFRVQLLDHDEQKSQLEQLQRQVLQSGAVRIAAPPGKHDDLAMVLMLMAKMVLWSLVDELPKNNRPPDPEKDHVKMGLAQIERKKQEALQALEMAD